MLIMNNLEKSFTTKVDRSCGNASGTIVEMFNKPRASTIFGLLVYSLDGPGLLISISGPHKEFSNISFGIWMG